MSTSSLQLRQDPFCLGYRNHGNTQSSSSNNINNNSIPYCRCNNNCRHQMKIMMLSRYLLLVFLMLSSLSSSPPSSSSSWLGLYSGGSSSFLSCCNALNPIEIRGYKFFDSVTDEEFRIRGIDYYPRPNRGDFNHNSIDYFTEQHRHVWERDIPYLQTLGVNAIRIYAMNATQNHDAFFCALERVGMYALVELAYDCPTCAVTIDASPKCYPKQLKSQGQALIRALSKYSNVLGFSAGNEVNHFAPPNDPQHNGPCQKKFLRDMRYYIDTCANMAANDAAETVANVEASASSVNATPISFRRVPIGLVAADSDRMDNALYYNCQSNESDPYEFAEWYGLNSYVNCDGHAQTYTDAMGFHILQQDFESMNYSIPVVLTEFGCLSDTFPTIDSYQGQRTFLQAYWLHNETNVRDQFVGGFVFEYSMEMEIAKSESPWPFTQFGHANYGIGYFAPEDCDDVSIPCEYQPLPAFDHLRQQYLAIRDGDDSNNNNETLPMDDSRITSTTFSFASRQGRTECPAQFPPLSEFDWDVDHIPNLPCPKQPRTFVCPANLDDLRPKKPSSPWGWLKQQRPLSCFIVVAVVGVIIATATAFVGRLLRRRRTTTSSGYDTIKEMHDDIMKNNTAPSSSCSWLLSLPAASQLVGQSTSKTADTTTAKLRRSDGDTASSESVGLLSMTDITPKCDYHAIIDSNSSMSSLNEEENDDQERGNVKKRNSSA